MFMSCEVAFYKLKVCSTSFTNYHHIVESNFKEINLWKLLEETILMKCIMTLDYSNIYYPNAIETAIRTFVLSNSSSNRNSLAISYN